MTQAVGERWVQDKIRELLFVAHRIDAAKVWGNSLMSGWPDLFCGSFWIEVKAPGKKLRASQVEWMERWEKRARIYVCDDHRKLFDIIGEPPGSAPSNWRQFAPRVHHRDKMASAVAAWSTPPGKA